MAQARASLRNVLLCVSRDLHDVKMIRFSAVFEGGQSLPRDASLAPEKPAREASLGRLCPRMKYGPAFKPGCNTRVNTACFGCFGKDLAQDWTDEHPVKLTFFSLVTFIME